MEHRIVDKSRVFGSQSWTPLSKSRFKMLWNAIIHNKNTFFHELIVRIDAFGEISQKYSKGHSFV